MLISILIPSFNSDRFVKETLESIQRQTYKNFEVIFCDGGSNDNTLEIVKNYNFITKVISEPDLGPHDSINRGANFLNGEVVAWVNTDDVLTKNCLEVVAQNYKKTGFDIFTGSTYQIDSNSKILKSVQAYRNSKYWLDRSIYRPTAPAIFFRKSTSFVTNPMPLKYNFSYDYWLWKKLSSSQTIRYVNTKKVLGFFRIHNHSITTNQELVDGFKSQNSEIDNLFGAKNIRRKSVHKYLYYLYNFDHYLRERYQNLIYQNKPLECVDS